MPRKKKRWDRNQYPPNWDEISFAFRKSKNFTCEECKVVQGTQRTSRIGRKYSARVHAAHKWPNDTANPNPELLCLCEICHRVYDNTFAPLLAEGLHQVTLHEILLERRDIWYDEPGVQDSKILARAILWKWFAIFTTVLHAKY